MTAPLALLMNSNRASTTSRDGCPSAAAKRGTFACPVTSLMSRSPATVIASAKPGRSSWARTLNANVAAGRQRHCGPAAPGLVNATLHRHAADMHRFSFAVVVLLGLWGAQALAQPNLNDVPADLVVPVTGSGAPAPGLRVRATTAGWEGTGVHHTLYLPPDWRPEISLPVIVEYAGNGGYANRLGDVSDGSVEGGVLGYGLSAGRGFLWLVLPFVERDPAPARNTAKWWGDVAETKRYCLATVRDVCRRFGGDPRRVVLMGFSRGAIACTYLGLHDDEIAQLWCGFLAHSHFEGEFKHPAPDQAAWPERLRRIGPRPLLVSQEVSTAKTAAAIATTGIAGDFTFVDFPFPNHSARWALCDVPLRQTARAWLQRVVREKP